MKQAEQELRQGMDTRTPARIKNTIGFLVLAAIFSGCAHQEAVPQSSALQMPLPNWQPNPVVLAQLGSEIPLYEYSIRPPQGYDALDEDLFKNLHPYGLDGYLWHHIGDTTAFSFLDVTIVRRRNLETPTDILDKVIDAESRRYGSDFVRTKTEAGSINHLPFARTHWQRVERHESGDTIEMGFTYATVDMTKGVFIEGTDTQPCPTQPCSYRWNGSSPIPVLEAAALTFHQR